MPFRTGLLAEIVRMAMETLRTNKMRSALTILGVVIGITAIVGMTSLVRGFDQSLRDSIKEIGPNTIFIQKFGFTSLGSGAKFRELIKRPNLTIGDAEAIASNKAVIKVADIWLGGGPGRVVQERIAYGGTRSKLSVVMGATETFADVNFIKLDAGRFFTETEVRHRRKVIVLGHNPYLTLFPNTDPIGKTVRIGADHYTVVGVLGERPSPGGDSSVDDFAVIPQTVYQTRYGLDVTRESPGIMKNVMIVAVPQDNVSRDDALQEVETIMRIRHHLKLDEPDDFDLVTQDAALKVWDQVSRAVFLGLFVISSIALLVGGIGVMAIMMISVTERTREIGVRKALGARRREILWQFLIEAGFLTLVGGIIGVAIGAGIGVTIHLISGFPISLPWWSFALGLGFSASVGIFFGMVPAIKASRLDPIEALRYE
jgi:putative ABC transport system permease protein